MFEFGVVRLVTGLEGLFCAGLEPFSGYSLKLVSLLLTPFLCVVIVGADAISRLSISHSIEAESQLMIMTYVSFAGIE